MSEPPTELTGGILQQIANELPHNKWKPLGRVLDLPRRDLENIAASHPQDPVEQRYQMLQLWCSQNEDASLDRLTDALCSEKVGCLQLARKLQVKESKGVCVRVHICVVVVCACGLRLPILRLFLVAEPLQILAFFSIFHAITCDW